jgi:tetratricopeptide (TPR) repeat protein
MKIIFASIFGIVILISFYFFENSVNCIGLKSVCAQHVGILNNTGLSAEDVAKLVAEAVKAADTRADARHKADAETIKNLTTAVTALGQGQTSAKPSEIQKAFEALRQGDFSQALALFEAEAQRFEVEAKKGAEIQRNIGALAFFSDTQKSLNAYRRTTQLDPDNAIGWNELGRLLWRVGQLDEAIRVYETVFRLGQEHQNKVEIAFAYGNLGIVYQTRGDLDKAVEYYNKALKINESLGRQEGMAIQYGNLGEVYRMRGDLDKAVEYYNKALEISQNLSHKEYMASVYGNLGSVYLTRGDLDKAVEYYNKALKIHESLGSQEGMAIQYGNLGNVYQKRGDLDKAVEYYHKSLKIDENLGCQEGIAIKYANLGIVYKKRGDLKRARDYWQKSLALYKAIGSPMTKTVQNWLDELPQP